jgi:hypothetical protein
VIAVIAYRFDDARGDLRPPASIEGLQIESGQFAVMVPTHDLGEGIAAWIVRRQPWRPERHPQR